MPDVLATRTFSFAAPERGACDVLVIAGEHSGDEQAERMVSAARAERRLLKASLPAHPRQRVCARKILRAERRSAARASPARGRSCSST